MRPAAKPSLLTRLSSSKAKRNSLASVLVAGWAEAWGWVVGMALHRCYRQIGPCLPAAHFRHAFEVIENEEAFGAELRAATRALPVLAALLEGPGPAATGDNFDRTIFCRCHDEGV